jgi:hypothetical protein
VLSEFPEPDRLRIDSESSGQRPRGEAESLPGEAEAKPAGDRCPKT